MKPAVPIIPQPMPIVADRPPLTLLGTIVGETLNIAIFADNSSKHFIRLKAGQRHEGWTLREVGLRRAILEKDRRPVVLLLPARNVAQLPPAMAGLASGLPADAPKPPWLTAADNPPPPGLPVRQIEHSESISAAAPKPPWLNAAINSPPPAAPVRQLEQGEGNFANGPKPPWLNAAVNPPRPAAPVGQAEPSDSNSANGPRPPWLTISR